MPMPDGLAAIAGETKPAAIATSATAWMKFIRNFPITPPIFRLSPQIENPTWIFYAAPIPLTFD
jgi:hypothetical protein